MRVALVLAAVAGCHVTVRTELAQTRASRSEPDRDHARAQPATIAIAEGALRFVEPLVCPSTTVVELDPELQIARRANVATFVVGVIAVAGGAIAAVSALAKSGAGDDPLTYAGLAGIGIGLPFAIGPWIGNRTETRPAPSRTERRPGGEIACGSRPIAGGAARLTIGERQVYAAIGPDGELAVSPFTWVDAFDPAGGAAFAIHAELDDRGARRTIDHVVEAGALAGSRDRFLAATHLDVAVEPLRAVPRISAGAIRVGHVLVGSQAALHVVLPVVNAGPGDAWQVRAVIAADAPELDGRIVYVGHVAPRSTTTGELWVPLSPEADAALRTATLDLGFQLVDAHRTMPAAPLRFLGAVADDGFQ